MAYNHFDVRTFPNFRFYFGHKDLYIQYFGALSQPDGSLSADVDNFFYQIFRDSYKNVSSGFKNAEKYMEYLQSKGSFLIYKGEKKGLCFNAFYFLSQVNDEIDFVYFSKDMFETHFLPVFQA